jgi:hypothetical protein
MTVVEISEFTQNDGVVAGIYNSHLPNASMDLLKTLCYLKHIAVKHAINGEHLAIVMKFNSIS